MKCSSQRNCNVSESIDTDKLAYRLNEVQFPKELQRVAIGSP